MEDLSALQDQIDALTAQVTKQGSVVRQLKKDGAASEDIAEAVTLLKKLKVDAEALKTKQDELDPSKKFNRKTFDELILRKMFVVPSFEIHGGVKGLFDLGPPACALKVCFVLVLSLACDCIFNATSRCDCARITTTTDIRQQNRSNQIFSHSNAFFTFYTPCDTFIH